jgi:ferredoxin-NADP reductase
MLQTLADQNSKRPCYLWLANKNAFAVVGGRRIDELCDRLHLEVVHVFSKPAHTRGQRQDKDFVLAHFPDRYQQAHFYICGPNALMDMAEQVLHAQGVPGHQVHTERFQMV